MPKSQTGSSLYGEVVAFFRALPALLIQGINAEVLSFLLALNWDDMPSLDHGLVIACFCNLTNGLGMNYQ